jgi:hypothetical protein
MIHRMLVAFLGAGGVREAPDVDLPEQGDDGSGGGSVVGVAHVVARGLLTRHEIEFSLDQQAADLEEPGSDEPLAREQIPEAGSQVVGDVLELHAGRCEGVGSGVRVHGSSVGERGEDLDTPVLPGAPGRVCSFPPRLPQTNVGHAPRRMRVDAPNRHRRSEQTLHDHEAGSRRISNVRVIARVTRREPQPEVKPPTIAHYVDRRCS